MCEDTPYYRLLAHPFVVYVLRNMDSILKPFESEFVKSLEQGTSSKSHAKQPENAEGRQASSNLVLTEEQVYHNEIFEYTSNLTQAVEQLEETPCYLARFPTDEVKLADDVLQVIFNLFSMELQATLDSGPKMYVTFVMV